jgi:phage terminase small subunit
MVDECRVCAHVRVQTQRRRAERVRWWGDCWGVALTPKQNRFVAEYLVDLNATQAAIRAGYSKRTATEQSYDLLRKPQIRAMIDEAMVKRAERVEVKADDVLRELMRVGLADISQAYDKNGQLKPLHEMSEDVRRAIAGVEVEELYEGHGDDRVRIGSLVKVRFWDKTRGLEMLGRHLKMFTDKVEHEAGPGLEALLLAAREKNGKR